MATFDTPTPILTVLDVGAGTVRIDAEERTDTVVTVRPRDPGSDHDTRAAEQTIVDHADGRLVVRGPNRTVRSLFGGSGAVVVTISLPAGSRVEARTAAALTTSGRLGDCQVHAAGGAVTVERTGGLRLRTSHAAVSVGCVDGDADVATARGPIRVGRVEGAARIQTARGEIHLGEVAGPLTVASGAGPISVERAGAGVNARAGRAAICLGEVARGTVTLASGHGRLEVGIRAGTAALVDLLSGHGRVRNDLHATDEPGPDEETVSVRARTGHGDIVIRRATPATEKTLT
ncbi:conserved hypothetical protein [Parafrankia sp. EAN1pec]|uniref:DUF4097 family beta strand repeat-containing protein n=1 Tax=Parafrankia sp. (strain EAN1pec) TaxID=298653 RepID=UPI0000540CEC|nr:conserved hypothetical protein [Frankia sp. EAN1pec]